jgi:hypothetical protein
MGGHIIGRRVRPVARGGHELGASGRFHNEREGAGHNSQCYRHGERVVEHHIPCLGSRVRRV